MIIYFDQISKVQYIMEKSEGFSLSNISPFIRTFAATLAYMVIRNLATREIDSVKWNASCRLLFPSALRKRSSHFRTRIVPPIPLTQLSLGLILRILHHRCPFHVCTGLGNQDLHFQFFIIENKWLLFMFRLFCQWRLVYRGIKFEEDALITWNLFLDRLHPPPLNLFKNQF